jgi:hypothetical protein
MGLAVSLFSKLAQMIGWRVFVHWAGDIFGEL